jgi:benzoyl-CoA reductase subunit BamC
MKFEAGARMARPALKPKCTGCRHCEIACSLNHVTGIANPRRARIRVFREGNTFFPVIAGPFVDAACTSKLTINRATCPQKPFFIEAETGFPLKCDFCGIPPNPSCVRWCNSGALELVED